MLEYLALLEEISRRAKRNKLLTYYPVNGPFRRALYRKHIEFFEAGAHYRERLMMAANRIGKTEGIGGYETTLHLTGLYPDWWPGRRFDRPIKAWLAGDTAQTTRDIIQAKLLGEFGDFGTGLIPYDCLGETYSKPGVPQAVALATVKHVSGGLSRIAFKSYDQKRISFQGTEQDLIWLDEEPPLDIYTECLLRTMTCNGLILGTFTPLQGLTEVVLSYLPSGQVPERTDIEDDEEPDAWLE